MTTAALAKRATQYQIPAALVKCAERLSMARPQDEGTAGVLGALGSLAWPVGALAPGIYAGSKAESFGEGAKATLSNALWPLIGSAVGSLGGAGLGALAGAGYGLSQGNEWTPEGIGALAATGGIGGAGVGAGLGTLLGGYFGGRRGARKYNDRLREYRQLQRELAGPRINIYTPDGRPVLTEEEEEKAAAFAKAAVRFGSSAGRAGRVTSHNGARVYSRTNTGGPRATGPTIDVPNTAAAPVGTATSGSWGKTIAKNTVLPAAAYGGGYFKGNEAGQYAGAEKAIHEMENMPSWQHGLLALAGLLGQKGALIDYGLGRAHKQQQEGGIWDRLFGPDYLRLQSGLRDRRQNAPGELKQRLVSWFT